MNNCPLLPFFTTIFSLPPFFIIIYWYELNMLLLFPQYEVGGVFQRDLLLESRSSLDKKKEKRCLGNPVFLLHWYAGRAKLLSCCQKTSGFCQSGQEEESSFSHRIHIREDLEVLKMCCKCRRLSSSNETMPLLIQSDTKRWWNDEGQSLIRKYVLMLQSLCSQTSQIPIFVGDGVWTLIYSP